MQTNSQSVTELIGMLIEQHPVWAALGFTVIAALAFGFVYMLVKERFSRNARDIADAGNLMAEALKKNAETLATAPQIVQSFTALVTGEVTRATEAMERKLGDAVNAAIAAEFDRRLEDLSRNVDDARRMVDEIGAMEQHVATIAATAAEQEKEVARGLEKIRDVIPSWELWKNVADPLELVAQLSDRESWGDGQEIVGRIQELVATSADEPERVPSGFIEVVGDWCRKRNQFHMALWFYDQAVARDPDRISPIVELHALRAEYVPAERESSLRELKRLALERVNDLGTMGRIFNAFTSAQRAQELAELCGELTEHPRFKDSPRAQALFLRNMATAERTLASDQLTPQAWAHISAAYALDQSENILSLYVAWMLEREDLDFGAAYALCERLLKLDPLDVSYYILLARLYAAFHRHAEAHRVLAAAQAHVRTLEHVMRVKMANSELQRSARDDDPNFMEMLLSTGNGLPENGGGEAAFSDVLAVVHEQREKAGPAVTTPDLDGS